MNNATTIVRGLLGVGIAGFFMGSAIASPIPLSDTTTSAGTTPYGTNTTLAVPGSYTYGNTFGAGSGTTSVSSTNTSGFYDDYVFTISGASADSVTSTINLGNTLEINGLQAALFTYASGETVPVAGSPLASGWSTAFNSNGVGGTISVIPATTLNPGSYVLEIQGTVAGTAGGSYSGSLNLAPAAVPLPAGLPLLLSGVIGVGLLRRRRA
jgi:hypothetical protein